MNRSGGSPKMAIEPPSLFTSDITHAVDIVTGVRDPSLSAPVKPLSCAQEMAMRSSFGANSSTTADNAASTARSFATNLRTYQASLSDRLTALLISHGLVKGITPTSIRQMSGQPIRALAFDTPAGSDAAPHDAASSSSNDNGLKPADGTQLHDGVKHDG